MIIWGDGDLTHKGDKPCTLSLQFLLRDDKLQLSVMMRSQDIILGTPYDIFMFSELQRTVARLLDVDAGKYVHHVGSCHFYVRDLPIIAGLKLTTLTENTLPRGVILPHKRSDILWLHHELEALLDHGPDAVDEEFRALNPWYCTQIGKLFEKETEEKTA
jgi:thymidylate synthase